MDVSCTSRYPSLWTCAGDFGPNLASHTSHSYRGHMIANAFITLDLDSPADLGDDRDTWSPRSVANPARTTWTGFAKNDEDRLPAN